MKRSSPPPVPSANDPAGAIRRDLVRYLSVRSSYNPNFTHDDRALVFISDTTGVPQVWSLDLEEGALEQLTHHEDRVGSVSTAKTKSSFVYSKDHGGDERFQLFHVNGGGDELSQLTDYPDIIHEFGAWSPAEDSILYSSNSRDRAYFDVYTMELASRKARRVHQSDHTNYGADWSGESILMLRVHAPFNHDLFTINKDGSTECLTEHEGDASFGGARFAPDGKRIYFVTDMGREFAAPAILEPGDPRPNILVDSKWDVDDLALSDDGRRLAFTRNVDGVSRLTVWEPSGPQTKVKTPVGVIAGLTWSHRGDKLAFMFSGANYNLDIWIHDLHDGSTRRVTKSSASGLRLKDLQPRGSQDIRPSTDSTYPASCTR